MGTGDRDVTAEELLKRIAALWVRHRNHPTVKENVPQPLCDALEEAVRMAGIDAAPRSSEPTPTETPASRRK